jgi:polysaccharide deacetylase
LTRGYEPWPLLEIIRNHTLGEKIPRQAFAITFDDGYECVYRNAWPILKRLQIPATIFLSTAYLDSDGPFPCDDWLGAGDVTVPPEAWRPLTTSQCREMLDSGLIELGAHTHSHDDFRGRPEDLRQDLQQNLHELRERFDIQNATFAVPFGIVKEGFAGGTFSQVAKEAGMLCGLSAEPELIAKSVSPFYWGRFAAEQHDSAATLAAKLGGWVCALRGLQQAFRRRNRQ